MFMKIFTVIIISFNNIFTIPQNINNDETKTQLIRNKRESEETYVLNLSNVKIKITYNYNDKYEIDFYNTKKEEIINIPKWLKYDGTSSCVENWRPNCGLKSLNFEKNDIVWNELKRLKITIKNDKTFDKTEFIASNTHVKVANKTITTPIKILSFKAETQTKPTTDIDLPETTTKFDGNHNYTNIIDNLDYLMIHRGDFDKFNYSYLYWTPVFNFIGTLEKGYYKEVTIKNHGFKNESYFYHKTSSSEDEINKNILKIKAFNKTLIAGNDYLQLLHGESEIWKYDTKSTNDYYLIKYLFGTLNYLNVKFSFLRYDPDLRNDIYLYFKNNIPSINSNNYKNTFDEIYEILGNFFASLFYATFDMDEKTHTEIDFKGVDNYNKDYFIQIGFFYRSLITFYPKKYLINVAGNSELLLRSYFFTFDKKTHQDNFNAIKNNNSIYQIEFNVLKSYDNKLITLPTNKTANSINYLNTDIDIRYGINIFTLTFPLYHKGNTYNYNFKIYDFNVLNSTAFIPDGSNNSEWDDLIPPANCKYSGRWIPTFNDIGCAIQNS